MSIRLRLLLYFGLLSAAGAITFVVLWLYGVPQWGIEGIQTAELRRSIASVEAFADKERDGFSRWFVERRRELQLLVHGEMFVASVRGASAADAHRPAQIRARLERQLVNLKEGNAGVYNYLYVVNPVSGSIIASTETDWKWPPTEHTNLLVESAQPGLTEFVYLLNGPLGPEAVITDQVQGVDKDGVPTGELHGVLVAGVDLRAPLQGGEQALLQSLGSSGGLMLVDRNKKLLVSSAALHAVAPEGTDFDYLRIAVEPGTEGVKVLNGPNGGEVLMAFRHLHLGASEGLMLMATRGSDEALSSIRANFTRLVALGVLVFLLAMGLVLFAAKKIAASEAQIRQLNASLEQRVQQRTQELARANESLTQTLGHLERTQAELVESAKLASLGSLVAGVAHELNTPIGNALMAASTLNDEARHFVDTVSVGMTRSAFDQHLETTLTGTAMMMSNITRAAELISGFKQLAVDQTSDQRRRFNVADELADIQAAMGPTLRKLPYVLDIAAVTERIVMDSYPGPLSRSIINLINNALLHGFEGRDAGVISIQAHMVDAEHVEIVFSDDGVGMADEVRKHVFEPFFTTKLGYGGSGLGMNIVYNNVTKLLGGHIELESVPGKGTRYRMVLPLVGPKIAA